MSKPSDVIFELHFDEDNRPFPKAFIPERFYTSEEVAAIAAEFSRLVREIHLRVNP